MDTNCKANSGDAMRILNFRVEAEKVERFRAIAEADHRTVSQELRRLMEIRIAEAESLERAA